MTPTRGMGPKHPALKASEACIHMVHETLASQEAAFARLGGEPAVTQRGLRQTRPAPSPSPKGVHLPYSEAAAWGSGLWWRLSTSPLRQQAGGHLSCHLPLAWLELPASPWKELAHTSAPQLSQRLPEVQTPGWPGPDSQRGLQVVPENDLISMNCINVKNGTAFFQKINHQESEN